MFNFNVSGYCQVNRTILRYQVLKVTFRVVNNNVIFAMISSNPVPPVVIFPAFRLPPAFTVTLLPAALAIFCIPLNFYSYIFSAFCLNCSRSVLGAVFMDILPVHQL